MSDRGGLVQFVHSLGAMTTMTTTTFHRPRLALVAWMAALSSTVAHLMLLAQ
jgi:hypothetical protein